MAAVGDPARTDAGGCDGTPVLLAAQAFCLRRRRELGPLCRQSLSDARDATGRSLAPHRSRLRHGTDGPALRPGAPARFPSANRDTM